MHTCGSGVCQRGQSQHDEHDSDSRFLERKTGVKRAEVVTPRLVQDERGWLRLAS